MRLQKRLSSEGSSDDDESVGKDYDVVIIGNGPSAILLSYFLSGNWPYYNGKPIDDPILKERLRYVSQTKSLVLQDLEWLSEGMYDSRTMNPVSILFDHLFHPNADMLTNDESVIEWRYNPNNEVRHIVLGMGPAGGSWHYMNNSQLSVSLAQWLELPGYSYKEWFQENQYKVPNLPKLSPITSVHPDRTHTALVGLYYMDYVKKQNMSQNFKNNVKVTSVRQCTQNNIMHWCIEGLQWVDETTTQMFTLFSDNVALAVGASNIPRKLYITGEHYDFVCHALPDIETMINQKLPVLVVGCGLVALDAVLKLIANRIPVYHVFRRSVKDPELILNQLPSAYADYLQLKPLMTGKCLNNEYYKPLPQHNVVGILPNREVIIEHTNKMLAYKLHVNRVIILVGLLPDLSIIDNSDSLKEDPQKEFNIKTNPLDIDLYTYECRSRKGLYALGPLVGDNFVRLISGGALAITHGLFRKEYDAFEDSE
ncbi:oxidative stress-induced growth inhibitor 2 [Hydra vulgaris]|uniref:Oxidative stress-induced growth inhibitor 2 n=1 Tax=Hydra vulgaris TaxID=6087 RepID=T2M325_HYDVU|nr:oxidative stress-induced growth inhibitor 2 [Hydra vulgaris]XP_012556192.1 oxidative stress-induced growth inhibitor 2 [Hydra vulgaris]